MEYFKTTSFLNCLSFFRNSFYLLLEVIEATDSKFEITEIINLKDKFLEEWNKIYYPLNNTLFNSHREMITDEIRQNCVALTYEQFEKYKHYITTYFFDEVKIFEHYINKSNFVSFEKIKELKILDESFNTIKDIEDARLFYSYYIYLFIAELNSIKTVIFKELDFPIALIETDTKGEPLLELSKNKPDKKLKWNGTPSQFGFIIDLLIQGGYLEKPTSSFTKDANLYLQHFDITTTPKTLSIEISEISNHLSTENRKRIIIPHKDKLK